MKDVRMVLVGGFLGAGKTTLLAQAARRLAGQGRRVGLITNDQAAHLVDTGILRQGGFEVGEVAGGCFCCRFSDFVAASDKLLHEIQPDVLFGEPVGSCTDLSATVLQPLKQLYAEWFRLAPFTVVTDPARLEETLDAGAAAFPDDVVYIFRKQLEEADVIVLNKTDLRSPGELSALKRKVAKEYPGTPLLCASALRGEGVDEWLDFVLKAPRAGTRMAEVDYDRYAAGEAALGWLNCTVRLVRRSPGDGGLPAAAADWREFCAGFIERVREGLRARAAPVRLRSGRPEHGRGAEIAHLKLLLNTAGGSLQANLTSSRGEPLFQGTAQGGSREALLIVNARVRAEPDVLQAVIEKALASGPQKDVAVEILTMASFKPGRPQPTHRYSDII
jgi:Ni2+-binding GTPase involved in maturation of urease and hydrogenase